MAAPHKAVGPKPEKIWRDAIMVAVRRETGKGKPTKRLFALADKLVDRALDGDVPAMKEIGDRLDGRAAQPVVGATGGDVVLRVELVDLND